MKPMNANIKMLVTQFIAIQCGDVSMQKLTAMITANAPLILATLTVFLPLLVNIPKLLAMITMLVHKTIVAHPLDAYMKMFLTNV